MAEGESKCMFVERAGPSIQEAAEEKLSDIFFVGFKRANTGLLNASYYFIKDALMKMASNSFMDDVSEQSLERWTQTFSFTDASTQRVLNSSHFVRPVANFVCKKLKD